jgi:hypothetical protein
MLYVDSGELLMEARAPESTSVGLIKCVEPPVRCDSTVDPLM